MGACQLRKERFNAREERCGGDDRIRVGPDFEYQRDVYTTAKDDSHVNEKGVATYHLSQLQLTGSHDPFIDIRRRQPKERPAQRKRREKKEIAKFGFVRPNTKLGLVDGSKKSNRPRKAPDLLQEERELDGRDFVHELDVHNMKERPLVLPREPKVHRNEVP